MDSYPVAYITFYKYFTAPHPVTYHITGITMDNHLAIIHGITYTILGIGVNNDCGAVHKGREIITRDTVNNYHYFLLYAIGYIALSVYPDQLYLLLASGYSLSDHPV